MQKVSTLRWIEHCEFSHFSSALWVSKRNEGSNLVYFSPRDCNGSFEDTFPGALQPKRTHCSRACIPALPKPRVAPAWWLLNLITMAFNLIVNYIIQYRLVFLFNFLGFNFNGLQPTAAWDIHPHWTFGSAFAQYHGRPTRTVQQSVSMIHVVG